MKKMEVPENVLLRIKQIEEKHKKYNAPLYCWEELKTSLINGTHPLLIYSSEQEADENKVKLISEIYSRTSISCNHECYMDEELIPRLQQLSRRTRTKKEALDLIDIVEAINNGYGGWNESEFTSEVHYLKLIRDKRKFEKLKKMEDCEEVSVANSAIRVARTIKSIRTVAKEKGLLDIYERAFQYSHPRTLLRWHNVKETTILYIYAPIR